MTSGTTERERAIVREYMATSRSEEMLPFAFMGWVPCVARTAHQWLFEPTLNNAHTEPDGDFSQVEAITHAGMLLVGTAGDNEKTLPFWGEGVETNMVKHCDGQRATACDVSLEGRRMHITSHRPSQCSSQCIGR